MGLDITLLAVDWAHLRAIPADARTAWLEDAAWPDDQWPPHEEYQSGWTWPEGPGEQHWARYAFTMSSYKPHFWAGRRWDDVRDAAHPELRVALDTYLLALVWDGPDGNVRHDGPVFPGDPWDPEPLAVCPPADLPAVAEAWERARTAARHVARAVRGARRGSSWLDQGLRPVRRVRPGVERACRGGRRSRLGPDRAALTAASGGGRPWGHPAARPRSTVDENARPSLRGVVTVHASWPEGPCPRSPRSGPADVPASQGVGEASVSTPLSTPRATIPFHCPNSLLLSISHHGHRTDT